MSKTTVFRGTILCALFAVLCIAPYSKAGLTAPSAYRSFADSPFSGGTYTYFYLEDFEDGVLNTPGVHANGGMVLGPAPLTDSVDGDDGLVDGHGSGGHSFYSNGLAGIEFTFEQAALGTLPTQVGIVWTDVGFSDLQNGWDVVRFEAFDAGGISLGSILLPVGDGLYTGDTDEDRFFGVIEPTGISKITLQSLYSTDWEMDHLQYGAQACPVPVPGALVLGMIGTGILASRRRRR